MAIRKKVYRAVSQKAMVWFFIKMGVQSADARGLMANFTRCRAHGIFSCRQNGIPIQTLERTTHITRAAQTEWLNMFSLEGATEVQKEVFWSRVVHALQNNVRKVTILDTTARFTKLKVENRILGILYRKFLLSLLHPFIDDLQDTFRAEWAFLILFAPEGYPGWFRCMLADFKEGGWLPVLENIVGKSNSFLSLLMLLSCTFVTIVTPTLFIINPARAPRS